MSSNNPPEKPKSEAARHPGQQKQDGGDPSTAPEEGTEHGKSSSVKLAENHKTDESGAVID